MPYVKFVNLERMDIQLSIVLSTVLETDASRMLVPISARRMVIVTIQETN